MSGKLQLKGGISEPGSDIPPNWRAMRSKFGYTEVKRNRKKDLLRKIFKCTILISYGSKN